MSDKMTKAKKAEMVAFILSYYAKLFAAHSTGADQQLCEVIIRDMLDALGIQYLNDMFHRGYKEQDVHVRTRDGKWLNLEVKHGAGALAYAERAGLQQFTSRDRDLCLKGVDYVIYRIKATPDLDRYGFANRYRVATREDFLDMLEEYGHGPKAQGFFTATKLSKHGTQINIQSTYVRNFWDGMKNDPRSMRLYDFCLDVLGRAPRMDW